MSKYIIVGVYPPDRYDHKETYTIFFHTKTKYRENEPYFSTNVSRKTVDYYAVEKDQIANLLKIAQNQVYRPDVKKNVKRMHIFVLKTNSPKLEKYIKGNK